MDHLNLKPLTNEQPGPDISRYKLSLFTHQDTFAQPVIPWLARSYLGIENGRRRQRK